MAIRLTKENDHVQYGTTNFVADTDADIASLPTKVTPGSECFCIETSTTYILNNQGEWKVKSQGGGGSSPSYQRKSVTPNFSNGDVSVTADRRYKALSEVTIQKDSNLIADNIKKDVIIHGIEGNYELSVQEKSLIPNFNQGNVDVTPDNGYDGLSQVTIQKDANLVSDNIKKDVTVHGITGSYEGGSMSENAYISFTEIEEIGANEFTDYKDTLESANFPDVTSIGDAAFYECTHLTSINCPNATSIGSMAFWCCSNLTTINLPNVETIDSQGFSNCSSLTVASFPNVTTIKSNTFEYCSSLTTANFPSVTIIEDESAFYQCENLTSINFPSLVEIGYNTFFGCSSLTTASFPSVETIKSEAFSNCSSLATINIPNIETIESNGFSYCTSLAIIDLSNVSSIGDYAFENCENLATIILRNSSVVEINDSYSAFIETPFNSEGSGGTLYVPQALISAYHQNENWESLLSGNENNQILAIEGSIYE